MPPGFTVSWLSTDARPLTDRVTVTLWPDASVPAEGATVSLPIRLDGSAIDHVTGPPEAVRVILPPVTGLSRTDVGVTLSVPCLGGGGGAEEDGLAGVLVDGAGDVLWPDDGAVAEGEPPPVSPGELPAEGPGDRWTRPLAGTVGCADRPGPLGKAPDEGTAEGPDVTPALPPGPEPSAFGRP